jgi:acetolactate synthase-1/2/3 large subunit
LMGRVKADINININLVDFIERLSFKDIKFDFTDWKNSILSSKLKFPQKNEQAVELALNPDDLMKWISAISLNSNGFIVDVGQHQMWAAQSLQIGQQQRFITSGGLGSMGFALPAAIGAAIETNSYWTVITGDGCSQLSLSELQTVKHYNLPLVICIINNNQHGMVAQFQESNLDSRYIATRNDYSAPDFMKISSAFGIFGIRFEKLPDLEKSTELVKAWNKGPIILEFMVSYNAKALPKLGNSGVIGDL